MPEFPLRLAGLSICREWSWGLTLGPLEVVEDALDCGILVVLRALALAAVDGRSGLRLDAETPSFRAEPDHEHTKHNITTNTQPTILRGTW